MGTATSPKQKYSPTQGQNSIFSAQQCREDGNATTCTTWLLLVILCLSITSFKRYYKYCISSYTWTIQYTYMYSSINTDCCFLVSLWNTLLMIILKQKKISYQNNNIELNCSFDTCSIPVCVSLLSPKSFLARD